MFPCAHVYFSQCSSLDVEDTAARARIVGSVLPDAAFTGAFGWTDLHETANVDAFGATLRDDRICEVIAGVRHHIELDDRSHHAWDDSGGYAYGRQSSVLRGQVRDACGVDEDLARVLAHNFIETAVDLHLLGRHPEVIGTLRRAIVEFDLAELSAALASWKAADPGEMREKLELYADIWTHNDLSTREGMMLLWVELASHLNASTFPEGGITLRQDQALEALDTALTLVEADFMEVLTPSVT